MQLHSNSESVVHVYLIGQTLKDFVLSVWEERSYNMVSTLTFTSLILRRVSPGDGKLECLCGKAATRGGWTRSRELPGIPISA